MQSMMDMLPAYEIDVPEGKTRVGDGVRIGLHTAKCAVCGVQFEHHGTIHGYRDDKKYFCSYSCMRVWQRKKEQDKQERIERRKRAREEARRARGEAV